LRWFTGSRVQLAQSENLGELGAQFENLGELVKNTIFVA